MTDLPPIKRVLIVDDNVIEQRLCEMVIKRTGLVEEVKTFIYAQDVLDYLSADPMPAVDCVLLDINMPRMTGFEFLQVATDQLGPEFVKVVVVMLTTSLDQEDRRTAQRFPVVRDFFSKPLSRDHIHRLAELVAAHPSVS